MNITNYRGKKFKTWQNYYVRVIPVMKNRRDPLYIGSFHTGAYQEAISGYGGVKHCLQPSPKHILIDKDKDGKITTRVFAPEQSSESMLKILGF